MFNQGVGAEMIAEKWGLSRTYLDEMAVTSHERAAAATADGLFTEEIVAVGDFNADQGIRPGSNVEKLATLPTPCSKRVASCLPETRRRFPMVPLHCSSLRARRRPNLA